MLKFLFQHAANMKERSTGFPKAVTQGPRGFRLFGNLNLGCVRSTYSKRFSSSSSRFCAGAYFSVGLWAAMLVFKCFLCCSSLSELLAHSFQSARCNFTVVIITVSEGCGKKTTEINVGFFPNLTWTNGEMVDHFPVIPLAAVGKNQSHRLGFNAQDENLGSWYQVLPNLFCDESITRSLARRCRLNS